MSLGDGLTTAIISDALDAESSRDQVLQVHLMSLVAGDRAIGRARTLVFAPADDDGGEDPYRAAIDFIDSLEAGDMVVIATGDSRASAFWGELFSAAALGSGAVGVVTDGCVRDVANIRALGIPVFAASRRPVDYKGRMMVVGADVSASIGSVVVAPGDLVVADDDGVVVVPRIVEDAVLARARDRLAGEAIVLSDLVDGASLATVWERHRLL